MPESLIIQTSRIDHAGRPVLPMAVLEALGIGPDEDVIMEVTKEGLLIRPKGTATSITERIAAMALPVAGWKQMEQEIEGRAG